eukprot:COSAG01_NODE_20765_length_936_cov_6.155317_2_plen_232_part_00
MYVKVPKMPSHKFFELNAPVKFTILLMLNTAVPVPQSEIWTMCPRAVVVRPVTQQYCCVTGPRKCKQPAKGVETARTCGRLRGSSDRGGGVCNRPPTPAGSHGQQKTCTPLPFPPSARDRYSGLGTIYEWRDGMKWGPPWNPLNQERRAGELSPAVGPGANRVATGASLSGPSRLCLEACVCLVHLVGEMNCRFVSSRIQGSGLYTPSTSRRVRGRAKLCDHARSAPLVNG